MLDNYSTDRDHWLFRQNKMDKPVLDRYMASVYFVVQTVPPLHQISTTGYGDATGGSENEETALRIFFMITGVVVYSLCTGEIMDYSNKVAMSAQKLSKKIARLHCLSRKYNLPLNLIRTVEQALVNNEDKQAPRPLDLSNLSKEEVELFYYVLYINKYHGIKMFQTKDEQFILKLGSCLQRRDLKKNEMIFKKDDSAVAMYLLKEGHVGFMLDKFDTVPFVRVESGFFGEYELLFNTPRQFTARALTEVVLFSLNMEDFKEVFLKSKENRFIDKLYKFASERANCFTQVHNKFELLIKKQLFESNALEAIGLFIKQATLKIVKDKPLKKPKKSVSSSKTTSRAEPKAPRIAFVKSSLRPSSFTKPDTSSPNTTSRNVIGLESSSDERFRPSAISKNTKTQASKKSLFHQNAAIQINIIPPQHSSGPLLEDPAFSTKPQTEATTRQGKIGRPGFLRQSIGSNSRLGSGSIHKSNSTLNLKKKHIRVPQKN